MVRLLGSDDFRWIGFEIRYCSAENAENNTLN